MNNEFIFFLIGLLLFLGSGATQPYVVPYLKDLGYSSLLGSLVIATIYFSQIPTRFLIPKIEGLLGKKLVVILGITGYTLYAILFALGKTLWHFMFATVVLGFTSALFWTSGIVLLLNNTPRERYGRAVGALYAGVGLGTAIGVIWLNKVLASLGGKYMFLLASIPPAIGALFMLKLKVGDNVISAPITFKALKEIANRETFIVSFLLFVSSFSYGIVYSGFSILIIREIGIGWIGVLTISFYLFRALFSRIGGGISDFIGRKVSFIISFTLGALASFLLGISKNPIMFVVSGALLGYQVSTVSVNANAWIADIASFQDRPIYIAFTFTFNALGVAISLLISGYFLATPEKTYMAFTIFSVINIISAILSFLSTERR